MARREKGGRRGVLRETVRDSWNEVVGVLPEGSRRMKVGVVSCHLYRKQISDSSSGGFRTLF